MTTGLGCTLGSYASQIAIAKYGTTYYWMATAMGSRWLNAGGFTRGIKDYFWSKWGAQAGLQAAVFLAGFWDLATDLLATDIMAGITSTLEGGPASSTFTPNTQNTFAWIHAYPPNIVGQTGTFTVAGVPFVLNGNANSLAGCNTFIAALAANGTTNAVVVGTLLFDPAQPGGGAWLVVINARAPGDAGNAVTVTYDAGGGSILYPNVGHLSGGADATITISPPAGLGAPQTILSNFDTDADTTVNNIIGLIAANGVLNTLVVGTLVNHKMLLTAIAPGVAGNSIGVTANNVFDQIWVQTPGPGPNSPVLLNGGYDGAVQSGVPTIVLCTVPPFGASLYYTAGRETQRGILNAAITAYVGGHPAVTLADADATLKDGGNPVNLNPAYDAGNGLYINDAGQTALFGLINPLLP
jgi:hypothetical protein